MEGTRTVLFVCRHGAVRSIIAAEYFQRLAARRGLGVRAASAGVTPDPEIPFPVVQGLLEDGIDVRGRRPRPVTREDLAKAWHVVSFGCDLSALAPSGLTVERWDDVPPVGKGFKVFRDRIVARLHPLLARCEGLPDATAI